MTESTWPQTVTQIAKEDIIAKSNAKRSFTKLLRKISTKRDRAYQGKIRLYAQSPYFKDKPGVLQATARESQVNRESNTYDAPLFAIGCSLKTQLTGS